MLTRRLGKNGPDISVVGYGAWEIGGEAYGPNPPEQQIIDAIHAGIDAGIDWIDTAEVYGKGRSEELVGKAVASRRDEVKIATKVAPHPGGTGYEPDKIRVAAMRSMERMGIDHIDLYQLHWKPEESWPIEPTWEAMAGLVEEGLVGYIGVSNFTKAQIERCMRIRHVDSLQPQLSAFHRQEEELIRWCGEQGIGVIVYGPLAYGLLTGAVDASTRFHEQDWRSGRSPDHPYYVELFAPGKIEEHLKIVEQLRPIAAQEGIELSQLALAWALARPGVTAVIAGSRNAGHIRMNAATGDVLLADEVMRTIDGLIPSAPIGDD